MAQKFTLVEPASLSERKISSNIGAMVPGVDAFY